MSMKQIPAGVLLVMLAGSAVSAEPLAREMATARHAVGRGEALPHNLAGGEPGAAGDYEPVFDNMTDADSSTGYNVAYVNPGSYDGSNPSSDAYHVGMSSTIGGFDEAPLHPDSGIPMDIWFDEYAAEEWLWSLELLHAIDLVPAICPALASNPTTQDWILFWGNVNFDGDLFRGAVQITWPSVSSTYCGWFGAAIDLYGNDIDYDFDEVGWVIVDWRQDLMESDEGCGMMIAGGDLLDGTFPMPDEQWTLGETDFTKWIAGDGVTDVDPGWDGDPNEASYLDVFNTGDNINWAFVDSPTSPTSELTHDFPFRLYVGGGDPCLGDLNGDGDVDQSDLGILLASYLVDSGGDLNGDGVTDQQDLGILLADYGCGT